MNPNSHVGQILGHETGQTAQSAHGTDDVRTPTRPAGDRLLTHTDNGGFLVREAATGRVLGSGPPVTGQWRRSVIPILRSATD